MDTCSGHVMNDETRLCLSRIGAVLKMLPPNTTQLIQLADSFIIHKMKDAWRMRWKEYKYECIHSNLRTEVSGKFGNTGKSFFLSLAAVVLHDLNHQKDNNGIQCARIAVICTEISLKYSMLWKEGKLRDDFQQGIAWKSKYFEVGEVDDESRYINGA